MLVKKSILVFSVALTMALFGGCGGGSTTNKDDNTSGNQQPDNQNNTTNNDSNTSNDNNTTNNDNNNDPVVAGYAAGNGVLVETRSDGTKRAWVNATSTACLIYRIAQHPGTTILEGGTAHCDGLNHGGITTWRMPTEAEAVYVMANVSTTGADRIIYPSDNPNCQYMATNTSGRFVYTTNNANTGAFTEENRGVAGIRCVADQ